MRLPGDHDPRLALAVWWRNATVYRRTWMKNILPNFFEPLLYLVGMGVGLGAYLGEDVGGMSYVGYIAPGLMAASAMNGATFETTYNVFVKMTFGRLYDAYLGTPAQIQDIAMGELLWGTTRGLLYGIAFWLVTVGLTFAGLPIITSPWGIAIPVALAITGVLFSAIGELFTSWIETIDLYSYYYTLFLTPLFLFSGIFFPTDRFPYGDEIAWCTPLYHSVRVVRGLAHGVVDETTVISLVWMVVVSVVLYSFVPGRMRRRLMK